MIDTQEAGGKRPGLISISFPPPESVEQLVVTHDCASYRCQAHPTILDGPTHVVTPT